MVVGNQTLRQLLVHPKDSRSIEEKSGLVNKIPCKDCSKVYIGEMGRNFGVRKKNMKDVANFEEVQVTPAASKASQIEQNKSALTDHVALTNHTIDWDNCKSGCER